MPDQTVSITISDANVAEARAAFQHQLGLDAPATATDFKVWMRRQVKAVVLKYRESQRSDIDHTDPTADGNVFTIRARTGGSGQTRLLVDEDGDLYSVTGPRSDPTAD